MSEVINAPFSRRAALAGFGTLAAAGALALAGCGRGAGATGQVSVGWIEPKTGRLAAAYKPIYVGGRLALDDIAAAGGMLGEMMRVTEVDDKGSPATQSAIARRVVGAEPSFVVGPTGSSQVLASASSLARERFIQSGWGGSANLGNGKEFPYFYQLVYNTTQQAEAAVRFLRETRGAKRIGLIVENSEFGESIRTAAIDYLASEYSTTPVAVETFEVDANDMTPFVRKLEAAKVDGLGLFTGQPQATVLILRAMRSSGFAPTIVSHDLNYVDALSEFRGELLDNFFGTTYRGLTYTATETPPERVTALVRRISAHPDTAGLGYSAITSPYFDYLMLMADLVAQEKTADPQVLKKALDGVAGYQGVRSKISFTEDNHTGIADEEITIGSLTSALEPESLGGVLRRRADGV
ncbi:ABC transporter substrate-binding protein [Nocardia sp. NBC_01329]|uniref:ABC transporter substrate-binding protein n=1 Tax=Nocardia sp. NBC_01329 TaxID=2903594 RepID=UPI002E1557CA|nr:ABC transporter substrate-binding protein [Nocardia sp. NBC_01329]